MKKSLTVAQLELLAKIMEKARALADAPVQGIEFTDAELEMEVEVEVDLDLDLDCTMLSPVPAKLSTSSRKAPCPGRKKISIRVPHAVLQAFEDEAKRKGTGYQTLINRVLKETSKGW